MRCSHTADNFKVIAKSINNMAQLYKLGQSRHARRDLVAVAAGLGVGIAGALSYYSGALDKIPDWWNPKDTPSVELLDRDCRDFQSQSEAQAFFEAHNPENDPHGLDADGDGKACEWLP